MKLRKGDKVVCFTVKNISGVDFTCIIGELETIKKHWTGLIYVLKGQKSILLHSKSALNGHLFELSASVWTILPWNDKTKDKLRSLREAAILFQQAQAPLVKTRAAPTVPPPTPKPQTKTKTKKRTK